MRIMTAAERKHSIEVDHRGRWDYYYDRDGIVFPSRVAIAMAGLEYLGVILVGIALLLIIITALIICVWLLGTYVIWIISVLESILGGING